MDMHDTKASRELQRVSNLIAFNVNGATRSRKVNQHLTWYRFDDGSWLLIYSTSSYADIYLETPAGCIYVSCKNPLRINK